MASILSLPQCVNQDAAQLLVMNFAMHVHVLQSIEWLTEELTDRRLPKHYNTQLQDKNTNVYLIFQVYWMATKV